MKCSRKTEDKIRKSVIKLLWGVTFLLFLYTIYTIFTTPGGVLFMLSFLSIVTTATVLFVLITSWVSGDTNICKKEE